MAKLERIVSRLVEGHNKENGTDYKTMGLYSMGYTSAEQTGVVVGFPRNTPIIRNIANLHIKKRLIEVKPDGFMAEREYVIIAHGPELKGLAEQIESAFTKKFPQYDLEMHIQDK